MNLPTAATMDSITTIYSSMKQINTSFGTAFWDNSAASWSVSSAEYVWAFCAGICSPSDSSSSSSKIAFVRWHRASCLVSPNAKMLGNCGALAPNDLGIWCSTNTNTFPSNFLLGCSVWTMGLYTIDCLNTVLSSPLLYLRENLSLCEADLINLNWSEDFNFVLLVSHLFRGETFPQIYKASSSLNEISHLRCQIASRLTLMEFICSLYCASSPCGHCIKLCPDIVPST